MYSSKDFFPTDLKETLGLACFNMLYATNSLVFINSQMHSSFLYFSVYHFGEF